MTTKMMIDELHELGKVIRGGLLFPSPVEGIHC